MIYIFGGVGKTGCSCLAIDFAQQFGLRRAYGGAFMREEAIKAGFFKDGSVFGQNPREWDLDKADLLSFREMCKQTDRNIDAEIEKYLLREMLTSQADGEDLVVESKTMSRLLNSDVLDTMVDETARELGLGAGNELGADSEPDAEDGLGNELRTEDGFGQMKNFTRKDLLNRTKAVWIHADLEVRAKRTLGKECHVNGMGGEGGLAEESGPAEFPKELIEKESLALFNRQMSDKEAYVRFYNMYDYPEGNKIPPETYGQTLINNGDKESGYARVLEMMEKV